MFSIFSLIRPESANSKMTDYGLNYLLPLDSENGSEMQSVDFVTTWFSGCKCMRHKVSHQDSLGLAPNRDESSWGHMSTDMCSGSTLFIITMAMRVCSPLLNMDSLKTQTVSHSQFCLQHLAQALDYSLGSENIRWRATWKSGGVRHSGNSVLLFHKVGNNN